MLVLRVVIRFRSLKLEGKQFPSWVLSASLSLSALMWYNGAHCPTCQSLWRLKMETRGEQNETFSHAY